MPTPPFERDKFPVGFNEFDISEYGDKSIQAVLRNARAEAKGGIITTGHLLLALFLYDLDIRDYLSRFKDVQGHNITEQAIRKEIEQDVPPVDIATVAEVQETKDATTMRSILSNASAKAFEPSITGYRHEIPVNPMLVLSTLASQGENSQGWRILARLSKGSGRASLAYNPDVNGATAEISAGAFNMAFGYKATENLRRRGGQR